MSEIHSKLSMAFLPGVVNPRLARLDRVSLENISLLDFQNPGPPSPMHGYENELFLGGCLVEETEDLAGNVLAASLLVVHDTGGGGQDDEAELTRGEELDSPLLEVTELDGVAGVDDTALVETAVQLDDDLAGTVVVNLLELANVALKKNRSQ